MSGFIASFLLLLGVLTLAAAISASRRPHPPRWLIEGFSGEAISLASVGLLSFGIGYAIHFIATLAGQSLVLLQVAVLLATPVSCWAAWRLLAARQSFRAMLDGKAEVVPLPTTPPEQPTTPRRPDGNLPRAA